MQKGPCDLKFAIGLLDDTFTDSRGKIFAEINRNT